MFLDCKIVDNSDVIKELENNECMFFGEMENGKIVRLVYKKVYKGFDTAHKEVYYNFTKCRITYTDYKVYFQSEDFEQELDNIKETDKINKVDWIKNNTKYTVFKYKVNI